MPIYRITRATKVLAQCASSTILQPKFQDNNCRFIAVQKPKQTKALKKEKEKVRMYIVQRYIDYVKDYTAVLEARFPTAVKMYRVFSTGIRDFLRDLKTYISLRLQITKDQGFSKLTREDIELYYKMPSDMWRIAPVLVLSAIPFGNYVIFPLAFLRPKTLLCSHFWSIQQKVDFSREDLTDRLKNNKPVFRALQAKLDSIPDGDLKEKWQRVLALLGSGVHPDPSEILECKDLFVREPYQLTDLTYSHLVSKQSVLHVLTAEKPASPINHREPQIGYLLKMHGLKKSLLRKNKLKYQAFILLEMDKAIQREGGVEALNMETLQYACHIRGLHSRQLSTKDMRAWLEQWLTVSKEVDKNSYSLILHCPIFFAYNHPQNWMLIY